jgi:DNA-directed RNA polymerase specialized sigma24 family protein
MDEQADEEFREFMLGRWPSMVRLAYGLTGDQGQAEDLVQTAFAKTYASWSRARRVAERLTGQLPEPGSADTSGEHDERLALIAALRTLGSRQRAVVVLRYWAGLTETETAAALGCSVGTVKSQAARALASLRKSTALVEEGRS